MQKFYGFIHYNECLFSFDPAAGDLELIDRIASASNRKSKNTSFGSLAFELSADGKTIFYITAGGSSKRPGTDAMQSEINLVTYDIPLRRYTDHGPVQLDDGRRPTGATSLAVGSDGKLYSVGYMPVTDLDSTKGKGLIEARFSHVDKRKLKESISEVNLIVIDNPLAK